MNRETCWHILGIAPTGDAAVIRRAYATRLRAIDSDRDADGFAALREAREQAMAFAVERPADTIDEASTPSDAGHLVGSSFRPPILELDAVPVGTMGIAIANRDMSTRFWTAEGKPNQGMATPATVALAPWRMVVLPLDPTTQAPSGLVSPHRDVDADYSALYELLAPEDRERTRTFPNDEEASAMVGLFKSILRDPRLASIDFLDQREAWLSHVLAVSWPTSEPLVTLAVNHFGWAARRGEIGQDAAADFLAERSSAIDFEMAVQQPDHRLHKAWTELTKPVEDRSAYQSNDHRRRHGCANR